MNLIIIKPNERSTNASDGATIIDLSPNDERTQHLLHHLHKKNGDIVSIGFIDSYGGWKCKAIVQYCLNNNNSSSINNNNNNNSKIMGVRLVPICNEPSDSIKQSLSASIPQITILLAVPFPSRLKYLWPVMASFTFVTRIIIVKSTLSNPEFIQSKALNPSMYQPLIEKGMSQGGRTRPIQVDICVDEDGDELISKSLLERLGLVLSSSSSSGANTDNIARIFFDCGDENDDTLPPPPPARDLVLKQCCRETTATTTITAPSAILAIGPERGWTDNEANIFVNECGFTSATLGSSILRVDTAVVSALSIVSAALDECQKEMPHSSEISVVADDRVKRKRIDGAKCHSKVPSTLT